MQVCARLAAEDLFTYRQIAQSVILKKGLRKLDYTPFDSHTAVSMAVRRYAHGVKTDIISYLKEKLQLGERFSITTDECTAKNLHRFADVNIHFPREEPRCIGMIRIRGSFTAEAAVESLEQKLRDFSLDINTDIVGTTTDGASVMVAMGPKLPTIHQLCHAHGIHLAVVAVVYQVRSVNACRRGLN